jgi:hypothetical protein
MYRENSLATRPRRIDRDPGGEGDPGCVSFPGYAVYCPVHLVTFQYLYTPAVPQLGQIVLLLLLLSLKAPNQLQP